MGFLKLICHYKKNRPTVNESLFFQNYTGRLSANIVNMKTAVSLSNKYVYSRIPKAANTTVVANLYNRETGKCLTYDASFVKKDYFSTLSSLNADKIDRLSSFFKFTMVRNPMTRICSAYLDKINKSQSTKANMVRNLLNIHPDIMLSFDDFLDYLEQGGINQNGHWSLQKDLLCFPIDEYEIIGKVENIDIDLLNILKRIYGTECELISARKHRTDNQNMILKRSQKKKIYKLYQEDYELFGY